MLTPAPRAVLAQYLRRAPPRQGISPSSVRMSEPVTCPGQLRSWSVKTRSILFLLWSLGGCGGSVEPPPGTGHPGDAQTPPTTSSADIAAWIETGVYRAWRCEAALHDARPPGPHGQNRVCSNQLLSSTTSTATEFPIGAASVKELGDGSGNVIGYAVAVRTVKGQAGAGWLWYERIGQGGAIIGQGHSGCMGCHAQAARDYVFTEVR